MPRPMRELRFVQSKERFLPVKPAAIVERLAADPRLSDAERAQFRHLAAMLAARFHFEFHRQADWLKRLYDPFDPDRDTLPLRQLEPDEKIRQREQLVEGWRLLLEEGNYVELPRSEICSCLELQTRSGLVIRASLVDYQDLRVFFRGVRRQQRRWRPWWKPWANCTETIHVFSRVALLVQPARGARDVVLLKLFKDVVAEDLEMLLPLVRVRMCWLDRLKIGSSMAGSLGTAAWKAFTAAILSPWVFLVVMTGFTVGLVKGILNFLGSKTRYMQALSANLYFQNVANNASALALLVDTAEAEELKETLLAYGLLYLEGDRDYTREALDQRIEAWLREQFGLEVDFEISDALDKLVEKQLLLCSPTAGAESPILKAAGLADALRLLDETWDGFFSPDGSQSGEPRPDAGTAAAALGDRGPLRVDGASPAAPIGSPALIRASQK